METQEDAEDHIRGDLGIEDDEGVDLCVWPFIPFTDGTQLDVMGWNKAKVGLTGFANFESDILRRPCTRELFAVFPDLQTSTAQSEAKAVIHLPHKNLQRLHENGIGVHKKLLRGGWTSRTLQRWIDSADGPSHPLHLM